MTDATTGAADRVFGIDLGTTYSAIAFLDESGQAIVCRNAETNADTTPSVVYFETPTNVVVGQLAKESAVLDPGNVVSLIKREMGRDHQLEFHGQVQTPETISALILKQLAAHAAKHTNGTVDKVVITVPAYFGGREREATKNAGTIAGLDVVGVLPEPVAAAVHYESVGDGADRTLMVYDLGGGTFDTTVIRVGANGVDVVVTDGDTKLGGADWDERLHQHLLEKFVEQARPTEAPGDDPEFMQELANKAEEVKKQLTQQESRTVILRFAGATAKFEVTRAEFEAMTVDLLDRTVDRVRSALAALEKKAPGTVIDEVLLVGGSTKMPMVTARLQREFGWSPRLHDPDLAVAKGAALFALARVVHRMQEEARDTAATPEEGERAAEELAVKAAQEYGLPVSTVKELSAKEAKGVLAKAYGVRIVDLDDPARPEIVRHLAFANEQLPIDDRTFSARTLEHDQTSVEIALYEQAGAVASKELGANNPLSDGVGRISGIPPQPVGQYTSIAFEMNIDADGLLKLKATELTTHQELRIEIRVGMSTEQLDEATNAVAKIAVSG